GCEVRVITDFENGGADVVHLDAAAQRVVLAPRTPDGARPLFIRARLEGIDPARDVTVELAGFHPPAGQIHLVVSDDGRPWRRSIQRDSPHVLRTATGMLEVTRTLPYEYTRAVALCDELAAEAADAGDGGVERRTLCTSEGGRPVPMLHFKAPGSGAGDATG